MANSKKKNVAIILAAGQGKRMNSEVHKQYLMLCQRPVLYYSLKAFEDSPCIDEIVLVVGEGEEKYCLKEIIEKYSFHKVVSVVKGGKERYHSVFNGISAISDCDYLYIHDGARPFVTGEMIQNCFQEVEKSGACVVGVPVKDTIKLVDENKNIKETLNRNLLWSIQTPQVFTFSVIKKCYEELIRNEKQILESGISITDDTLLVEHFTSQNISVLEGSYKNIKITTPEDLLVGEKFLS
ncbi:MAG: 2-C-methyl-D-erythritol 4-phosphate cytidylyltransferase [Lachnospiraceae bacterium]|nr:2-C-methyl-D-erythritol 4-phosphate cytidylyltransferase [Lachnospiraceae bacterium]